MNHQAADKEQSTVSKVSPPAHTVLPVPDDVQDDATKASLSKRMTTLERLFPISNVILETLSAAFEQLSSPHKSFYALIGLLVSFSAVIICIIELVYRGKKAEVTWKAKRYASIVITGWFYHPPPHDHKPFGSFADVVGLICAIFQLIFSTVQCSFVVRHRDYPVKISMFPIVFAVCLAWSRLMKTKEEHEHAHAV